MLRSHGVVGAFVEFAGDGVGGLSLADRATISNMSPEFGATATLFPIDDETLAYLRLTGRSPARVDLVERYAKEQGLWREPGDGPAFDEVLTLDLSTVEPSVAGPRRPQDRVPVPELRENFRSAFPDGLVSPGDEPAVTNAEADGDVVDEASAESFPASRPARVRERRERRVPGAAGPARSSGGAADDRMYRSVTVSIGDEAVPVQHGLGGDRRDHVLHQHVESHGDGRRRSACAERRRARAARRVRRSRHRSRPGSKAVTGYLEAAGLMAPLEQLGFALAGYGCTTCIGNSGPLDAAVAKAVEENDLVVAAVLSGNRNFEGRIHPLARASYLASPPLVVAFALAGRVDIDLTSEPLETGATDAPVFLADIWPTADEIRSVIGSADRSRVVPSHVRRRVRGRRSVAGAADPGGRSLRTGTRRRRTSRGRRSSTA